MRSGIRAATRLLATVTSTRPLSMPQTVTIVCRRRAGFAVPDLMATTSAPTLPLSLSRSALEPPRADSLLHDFEAGGYVRRYHNTCDYVGRPPLQPSHVDADIGPVCCRSQKHACRRWRVTGCQFGGKRPGEIVAARVM